VADAIVVLNAGSSSLKFSVFVAHGGGLEPDLEVLGRGLRERAGSVSVA
jgi:acetate kinase